MGYTEKNLAPGETILHRARYHWVFYRTTLLLLFLAMLLGASALYAARVSPEENTPRIAGYLAIGFLVLAAGHFVVRRIRAAADEYVVTNRRVIRKVGLIAREVEQAPVEKIQDVTVRQGVLARLLGYGDIVLETASESGRISIPDVAGPERFRSALWGQAAAPAQASAESARPSAAERLAELDELRRRGLLSQPEYEDKRRQIVGSL
jgi:membrane protein YdbS with pleckstrin-like domain